MVSGMDFQADTISQNRAKNSQPALRISQAGISLVQCSERVS